MLYDANWVASQESKVRRGVPIFIPLFISQKANRRQIVNARAVVSYARKRNYIETSNNLVTARFAPSKFGNGSGQII